MCVPGSGGPTRPPRRKKDPSHQALFTPPFQPLSPFLSVGIEHNLLTAFENPGKTLNVTVESDSATPWTVVCQGPLSMGFFRQEYWSGLLCPPPGNLPHPGTEPWSPALQGVDLTPATMCPQTHKRAGTTELRPVNPRTMRKQNKTII